MELLALFIAVSGLIWGGVFLRFAGLFGVGVAILILGTVLGSEFFNISLLTIDRAVIVASIGVYIVYRSWGWTGQRKWDRMDTWVALFMLAMTFTTFIHPFVESGSASWSRLFWYFIVPGWMYWLAREVKLEEKHLRGMYAAFALFGVYLAITSFAEKFSLSWMVYPRYIMNSANEEFLGRGRGPLLNPSGNGVLLTLCLSCSMIFLMSRNITARLAALASMPIYMVGIACTMTRCVWMGAAAAMFGIGLSMVPRNLRIPLAMGVLIIGGLGVALNSQNLVGFKRDKNVSVEDMKQSAHLRPLLAAIAWKMFQDRPIVGCGTGLYKQYAKEHIGDRDIDMPLEKARPYVQHNIFLALLVENGLLGLVTYVVLWGLWTVAVFRFGMFQNPDQASHHLALVFGGFLVGYLINGMFQDVVIMPMINAYLFFLAGVTRNYWSLSPSIAPQSTSIAPPIERQLDRRSTFERFASH